LFKVCIFILSFCVSLSALAAEKLRFSIFAMQPYSHFTEKSGIKGIFVDLAKRLGEEANIDLSFNLLPSKRLYKNMLNGESDCTFFLTIPALSKALRQVGGTGIMLNSSVLSKKSLPITRYEQLYGHQLGVGLGIVFGHKVDTDERIQKNASKGYDEIARMLKVGRVDAILGVQISLEYNLKQLGFDLKKLAPPLVLNSRELSLYCSPKCSLEKSPQVLKLKQALTHLRKRGELQSMFNKYFDAEK